MQWSYHNISFIQRNVFFIFGKMVRFNIQAQIAKILFEELTQIS